MPQPAVYKCDARGQGLYVDLARLWQHDSHSMADALSKSATLETAMADPSCSSIVFGLVGGRSALAVSMTQRAQLRCRLKLEAVLTQNGLQHLVQQPTWLLHAATMRMSKGGGWTLVTSTGVTRDFSTTRIAKRPMKSTRSHF